MLLTLDDYQPLTGGQGSIIDLLGSPPGIEGVELEVPPLDDVARSADLR